MDDTPGLGQPQQAAADKENKSDRGVSEAVASTYVTQLETRIAALELANAYIEEVRQADTPERSYRARRTLNPMKWHSRGQRFDPARLHRSTKQVRGSSEKVRFDGDRPIARLDWRQRVRPVRRRAHSRPACRCLPKSIFSQSGSCGGTDRRSGRPAR